MKADITVSIVSHGHGAQVGALLQQLAELGNDALRRVLVTLNRPEPELQRVLDRHDWPFQVTALHNPRPAGFGANHNAAFAFEQAQAQSNYFAVLNPDVRLLGQDPFPALLEALAPADAGCAYPLQVDAEGRLQDHERSLPTPFALLRRYTGLERHASVRAPDWVNAAFLLFPGDVFARIGGFDSHYHMYCEDVDLCLRLRLAGLRAVRVSAACVLHDGQRATRRSAQHLFWHVGSLWRLWNSAAYRDFKRLRASTR